METPLVFVIRNFSHAVEEGNIFAWYVIATGKPEYRLSCW